MPDWFPDWSSDVCVIVASGPSANETDLTPFKGRAKFIVVNSSWKLAPWADVLFGADGGWWNHAKGVPDFHGIKVTLDFSASRAFSLRLVKLHKGSEAFVIDKAGFLGMGGNSGFYAINLAIQFKAKKLLLVGFDMTIEHGDHWHGPHGKGLNNPIKHRIDRWRKQLDNQAEPLRKLGIEVINCSSKSALKNYRKLSLHEALALETLK